MPADADEARRLAEEILSGPEYGEPATPWWQEVLEWIDEAFSKLVGTLTGSGGGSVLGWVVVVVVVAAAIAVVALAVRTLRRTPRREDEEPSTARRRRRDAEPDWAKEAKRLEAEGRWREGLRARYRALVAELSRRRVVDPAAGRTTGEHRREVGAAAPAASGEFADAAELFDRAWYGGRDTGPDEAARFDELARTVERAAGKGGET